MIQIIFPLKALMKQTESSERSLCKMIGIARGSLRQLLVFKSSLKLMTINQVAQYFKQNVFLLTYPQGHTPISSTLAISYKISHDGFDSWKIHLMDMVDEFRKTLDTRLIVLPPAPESSMKIQALIAATVITLSEEVNVPIPDWTLKTRSLDAPWFLSEVESLKAFALLESPFGFRSKNIFVQENFLKRA